MGVENSPQRARRKREYEQRQEKRWAAKNGPVKVRFVDPATLQPGGEKPPAAAGRPGDVDDQAGDGS